MKDDLSQKIHRNIMFSLYSVKMIFVKKRKMIFSQKMQLKIEFLTLLEKVILILEMMVLAFYIDILEKVPIILCTIIENFLSALYSAFQ